MNVGQLKEIIKDLDDETLVSIQIESGRCCFSTCNDVVCEEYGDEDDEESVLIICGQETSSGD